MPATFSSSVSSSSGATEVVIQAIIGLITFVKNSITNIRPNIYLPTWKARSICFSRSSSFARRSSVVRSNLTFSTLIWSPRS